MSAAAAPRLTGGFVASVLLHGGLVAAFLVLRSTTPLPPPQMIQIHMIAAPQGDPTAGVVQETPSVPAAPVEKPPVATTAKPKPVAAAAKPKPAPKVATPTKAAKTETKPPTAAPTAAGGSAGGRGADVANIETPGIVFDYPLYTDNIVRELVRRFGGMAGSLEAEVRFVIKRDGSVDPSSIRLVTSSRNYSFDQRALSAVETAASAKAFGPLPAGFTEDILPVTFRFSPKIIR